MGGSLRGVDACPWGDPPLTLFPRAGERFSQWIPSPFLPPQAWGQIPSAGPPWPVRGIPTGDPAPPVIRRDPLPTLPQMRCCRIRPGRAGGPTRCHPLTVGVPHAATPSPWGKPVPRRFEGAEAKAPSPPAWAGGRAAGAAVQPRFLGAGARRRVWWEARRAGCPRNPQFPGRPGPPRRRRGMKEAPLNTLFNPIALM